MRWSGLPIQDALTLKRSNLQFDSAKGIYRITTKRKKTGTPVSVPIPPGVAEELLAVLNGNSVYVFWSGNGSPNSARNNWSQRYIAPIFKAAKIHNDGHMMSHRLRDTFAVDLLEKGAQWRKSPTCWVTRAFAPQKSTTRSGAKADKTD